MLPLGMGGASKLSSTAILSQWEVQPRADVEPGRIVAAADPHAPLDLPGARPRPAMSVRCRRHLGTKAAQLVRLLARHRAAGMPALLRPAAFTAWVVRSLALLTVVATKPYAASLPELPPLERTGTSSCTNCWPTRGGMRELTSAAPLLVCISPTRCCRRKA